MGGTTSTEINQIIQSKMLYKENMESISKNMTSVNTDVENLINQQAEQYTMLHNTADLSGTVISASGKDSKVNIGQSNNAKVKITVEQMTEVINNISVSITSEIQNTLESSLNMQQLGELVNNISNEMKNSATGALGDIGKDQDTKVNITEDNEMDIELNKKLENYIENVVSTTLKNHSDKTCGTHFETSNEFKLVNGIITVNDSAEVNLNQSNDVEITDECKQFDEVKNDIIINLCAGAGIDVSNVVEVSQSSSSTTDVTNKKENEGLGADLADAFGGIGDMFGGIFSGLTTPILIIGGVICCVILIAIVGIAFVMTDETGSQTLQGLASTGADLARNMTPAGKASQLIGGKMTTFEKILSYFNY